MWPGRWCAESCNEHPAGALLVYVSRPQYPSPLRYPTIIGHHLIWSAYGYWLPNDVRGSSSHGVRVEKSLHWDHCTMGANQFSHRLRKFASF
jgi:hypothetical protein